MLEVVVDPLLFHEPAHEVEIGLAVLGAVLALDVRAVEPVVEDRHRVVGEDLLDDVGNGLLLEDPTVAGAREEPEPRADRHSVFVVFAEGVALGEAGDVAVEVARPAFRALKLHGDLLAEKIARLDVAPGRQRRQLELRPAAELLTSAQPAEEEIPSQRARELHHPRHHGAHAISMAKSPLRTPRVIAPSCRPATMRARYSSLIRGRIVLVRIASIIRPPLSTSVHRETTSFTTASSYANGTLWCSPMRRAIRSSCRRTMLPRTVSGSG